MRNLPFRIVKNFLLCAVPIVGLAAMPAQAVSFGFTCITPGAAANCATGSSQFSVDVTDAGNDQVAFTFTNAVGSASSITDVYWMDGPPATVLLDLDSILDSGAGVAFSDAATPANLPGGASVGFASNLGFSADSDSPVSSNGVSSSTEWLTVYFNLIDGASFNDLLAAINAGTVRMGIHAQSFADDGGASFVNSVPIPAAAWLFGSALLGFMFISNRRRV